MTAVCATISTSRKNVITLLSWKVLIGVISNIHPPCSADVYTTNSPGKGIGLCLVAKCFTVFTSWSLTLFVSCWSRQHTFGFPGLLQWKQICLSDGTSEQKHKVTSQGLTASTMELRRTVELMTIPRWFLTMSHLLHITAESQVLDPLV